MADKQCTLIKFETFLLYQNSETSSPGLLGCPPFSGDYPVLLTFYSGYRKHLPNLFNTSKALKFERAYLRREIFVSKSIGLAIQLEVNLPFLLCFTLYLGAIFQVQAPGKQRRLNGGFFCVDGLGGLYLEGLIHWGAYFRNFTVTRGIWANQKRRYIMIRSLASLF